MVLEFIKKNVRRKRRVLADGRYHKRWIIWLKSWKRKLSSLRVSPSERERKIRTCTDSLGISLGISTAGNWRRRPPSARPAPLSSLETNKRTEQSTSSSIKCTNLDAFQFDQLILVLHLKWSCPHKRRDVKEKKEKCELRKMKSSLLVLERSTSTKRI